MAPTGGLLRMFTTATIILLINSIIQVDAGRNTGLCNVFEPFKVQPDNAKFQIGGPFSLHEPDCIYLRPNSVQELVAVQWALTHWNQNPTNIHSKLAMHAGDSCSRPQQAVSMTIDFLSEAGLFDPAECRSPADNKRPRLLGVMSPSDFDSTEKVARLLENTAVPVVTYTTSALLGFKAQQPEQLVISTAPAIEQYIEATLRLLKSMDINLVTVVLPDTRHASEIRHQLAKHGIRIDGELLWHETGFNQLLASKQANVTLTFLDTRQLKHTIVQPEIQSLHKLWINIPIDGGVLKPDEIQQLLHKEATLEIVLLQRHVTPFSDFKNYFLGVVKNNYPAYSLLATYMQQVYNCSLVGTPGFVDCAGLSTEYMGSHFEQAADIEPVVLSTFTLAALAARIRRDPVTEAVCAQAGQPCVRLIKDVLLNMDYEFSQYDPAAFEGFRLRYEEIGENVLVAQSIFIKGLHLMADRQLGTTVTTVLEYTTGSRPSLRMERTPGAPIRSKCSPEILVCQSCAGEGDTKVPSNADLSLSLPNSNYDAYIMGLFNFGDHYTPISARDLLYPLAFVHTLHTLQSRYPHVTEASNVGALVMNTNAGARHTVATLAAILDTQSCVQVPINKHARNITMMGGQLVGVVTAADRHVNRATHATLDMDSAALVTNQGELPFTLLPQARVQSDAIVQLLKHYDWDWVTVVVSTDNAKQVAAYNDFQLAAIENTICVAEEYLLDDRTVPNIAKTVSAKVVLLFTSAAHTAVVAPKLAEGRQLVLIDEAHDWIQSSNSETQRHMLGSISVQPRHLIRADFNDWLQTITTENLPEPWFLDFYERHFRCAVRPAHKSLFDGQMCTDQHRVSLGEFGNLIRIGYWIESIESLMFAIDGANRRLCPPPAKPFCQQFHKFGTQQVHRTLRTIQRDAIFDYWTYEPTNTNADAVYTQFANYSESVLHLLTDHVTYANDGQPSRTAVKSNCKPPLCRCQLEPDYFLKPLQELSAPSLPPVPMSKSVGTPSREHLAPKVASVVNSVSQLSAWPSATWCYVTMAIIAVLLLLAAAVLVLVCVKLYMRVVKGNQSLGICLLVSVLCLYATALLFVVEASTVVCRLRYCCHTLAYVLCFGAMIAKATQLRNRETLGLNGPHISYWNYWLLLTFIVGVQIALNLQWLFGYGMHSAAYNGGTQCAWSPTCFAFAQCYVVLLLFVVLFVSVLNRNVKRNYKETRWLLSTALLCVPIWAAGLVAFLMLPAHLGDLVIVIQLVCCASVVLCFMFGPKVYILLRYEPVLVEFPASYKLSEKSGDKTMHALYGATSFDFYEKEFDYEDDDVRANSPAASSSGASTRSTNISHMDGHASPTDSPVLQAVVRKKAGSHGSKRGSSKNGGSKNKTKPQAVVQGTTTNTTSMPSILMHHHDMPPAVVYGVRSSH